MFNPFTWIQDNVFDPVSGWLSDSMDWMFGSGDYQGTGAFGGAFHDPDMARANRDLLDKIAPAANAVGDTANAVYDALSGEPEQAEVNALVDAANQFEQSSADRAMQFEAEQAQLNRDWQERMSNSAWQRAVADMKAAGINPILAASQGGASTPAGAMATGSSASATTPQYVKYKLLDIIASITGSGLHAASTAAKWMV